MSEVSYKHFGQSKLLRMMISVKGTLYTYVFIDHYSYCFGIKGYEIRFGELK